MTKRQYHEAMIGNTTSATPLNTALELCYFNAQPQGYLNQQLYFPYHGCDLFTKAIRNAEKNKSIS